MANNIECMYSIWHANRLQLRHSPSIVYWIYFKIYMCSKNIWYQDVCLILYILSVEDVPIIACRRHVDMSFFLCCLTHNFTLAHSGFFVTDDCGGGVMVRRCQFAAENEFPYASIATAHTRAHIYKELLPVFPSDWLALSLVRYTITHICANFRCCKRLDSYTWNIRKMNGIYTIYNMIHVPF